MLVVVFLEPILRGYLGTTEVFDMGGHDESVTLTPVFVKSQLCKTKISKENK